MLFVSFGGVKTPLFFIKRCYGTLCKTLFKAFLTPFLKRGIKNESF